MSWRLSCVFSVIPSTTIGRIWCQAISLGMSLSMGATPSWSKIVCDVETSLAWTLAIDSLDARTCHLMISTGICQRGSRAKSIRLIVVSKSYMVKDGRLLTAMITIGNQLSSTNLLNVFWTYEKACFTSTSKNATYIEYYLFWFRMHVRRCRIVFSSSMWISLCTRSTTMTYIFVNLPTVIFLRYNVLHPTIRD